MYPIVVKKIKKINNSKQVMFIESQDLQKPVLLFLHGGPGLPEFAFFEKYKVKLSDMFTVCYLEQRGSGLSYNTNPEDKVSVEILIKDIQKVTRYLKKEYHKEKIFLMGHSWGSFLGVLTIKSIPDDFHAYFGVSQISNQVKSEIDGYKFILKKAKELNDKKCEKKIRKVGPKSDYFLSKKYFKERSFYLNKFGGGLYHKSFSKWSTIEPILSSKRYNTMDKVRLFQGLQFSSKQLVKELLKANLIEDVHEVLVPVYIFQGLYDYQTSYHQAELFYKQLKAPLKGFITFEKSAHCPPFEETVKFRETLQKCLVDISIYNNKKIE